MNELVDLRRTLHATPELSGQEWGTAGRIREFFASLSPDEAVTGLGGHGLAFVFSGPAPGPTVLLRCELDALPIQDTNTASHRSQVDGVSHKCGHDGHMAILASVGQRLAQRRPSTGRVVLLFQPAEETGAGAAAVVGDARFDSIRPDFSFALHNIPGVPLGQVLLGVGVFTCASRGMSIELRGATAHAAQPETGVSPAQAMGRIMEGLSNPPADVAPPDELAFITVVGAKLGEKAFGTAPGHAEVWATIRAETDETMARLVAMAEQLVDDVAADEGLEHSISYEDVFPSTVNSPDAVELVRRAARAGSVTDMAQPFRWSEDFGHFTRMSEGALFGIGSGEDMPQLHNSDYDFPDDLIPIAADVFIGIVDQCLGPGDED